MGNDEYARDNNSYGLTTFQDRHAVIRAGTITFKYLGKSGQHARHLSTFAMSTPSSWIVT